MGHGLPGELDPRIRAALDQGGFITHIGLEVTQVGPDRVAGRLEIDDRHRQPHGIVHGGVHAAVVETLGSIGAEAWGAETGHAAAVVGVANATDFLKSHRDGPLTAVATPIHRGRSAQLWRTEIRRESDDVLVAQGQVRLHNLREGPATPETTGRRVTAVAPASIGGRSLEV